MAPLLPVTLVGDNLGRRHRHLNSLVRQAQEGGVSIQDVEALPEQSAVDRLFKIDLAIQLKHVDYIVRNLKDDDMLYVSRALKATWLIDHRDIINPKYLEDVLFPEMIKPAVTKMKHWLYINLRDPATCQEFYHHYKDNTFDYAIKFLNHCNDELILDEAPKILSKLSTHSLKLLCEKCPEVAKIYFGSLATDEDVKIRYLKQEHLYYKSVKCVLKLDADVFLDITEKYFNMKNFSRLSPLATDYILRYHKTRFANKLELYVAYFLHIPTVAARLSVEECQEVVLKLARASYLQHWFQYKVVEPLIKRLSPEKRPVFKKLVFVKKDIGERGLDWPYQTPRSPSPPDCDPHIFDDKVYSRIAESFIYGRPKMKKRRACCLEKSLPVPQSPREKVKTYLDRLFDEFRFIGFSRALHDLKPRLIATGSADQRRDIFLVLVSKSGGRSDAVAALLSVAVRHINEPPHIRAAILRSLVKRAKVWRLPADIWQHLLDYGHGLGLDGTKAEAACREGLHAVVIRQLLAGECEPAVREAFMKDFSTLIEYSLKVDERERVANGLQTMLAAAATYDVPTKAVIRLQQLLEVIKKYRIRIEPSSPAVKAVMALAARDSGVAFPLLQRLYNERIARRELLRYNMEFRQDEAALLNALRHDPSVLEIKRVVYIMTVGKWQRYYNPRCYKVSRCQSFRIVDLKAKFDRFTSKLIIYFDQKQDFTIALCTALTNEFAQKQKVELARSLTTLFGKKFEQEMRYFDAIGKKSKKFAAALRACAHRARPTVNLAEWGWRKAGVRAVATRAMRCREIERNTLIRTLATERRTVRVALALCIRSASDLLIETFASAAKMRPAVALRTALLYFRRHGVSSDLRVWEIVKPLISSINLETFSRVSRLILEIRSKTRNQIAFRERLHRLLGKTDWIPSTIKPDYCITLYIALSKTRIYDFQMVGLLQDLSKLLPECDQQSFEHILLEMLCHESYDNIIAADYPTIFIRYFLLSQNEEDVERRFMKIGNRFLERLDTLRSESNYYFKPRLNLILESLKYNSAFLDAKFPSCLSVIGRILTWLQTFMPKDKYFNYYTQVRLTMLYFKAVRQSMKQMPEVFADPKRKKSEGVEAVGFIFGKYIVEEAAELVSTYFDSIIDLYTDGLLKYLNGNFMYGTSRNIFVGFILKGILTEAVGIQRQMAVYILREYQVNIKDSVRIEIEEQIMNDRTLQFFAHAELFRGVPVVPDRRLKPVGGAHSYSKDKKKIRRINWP
ncbi:hypothetical protein PYW08_010539 [Mythimna loreyi]|uniref:Uncharacterized protein n=1 Tax=Mythimna loreyi TaxID=667449 RepID=A0ACC2Q6Q7_9NEOP|nr:hypothetical protein PYW08_010539 [Mythimna loreyi]